MHDRKNSIKISLAIFVFAYLAISACSTTPKVADAETPQQAAAASTRQASTTTETKTDVNAGSLAADLQEMKKGVHFDFERPVVKPKYREAIQQRAEFLKAHGNIVATLEGNTDERGGSEYNLPLGEKHANHSRRSVSLPDTP